MRFLADENVPKDVVLFLRENGHEVQTAREAGLRGQPDDKVIDACNTSDRILITFDARLVPIGRIRTGMILLRPGSRGTSNTYLRLTKQALETYEEAQLRGSIVVSSSSGLRRRQLPNVRR